MVLDWIRQYIVIIGVIIVGIVFFLFFNQDNETETSHDFTLQDEQSVQLETIEKEVDEVEANLLVDIKGAVKQPGVYKVDGSDRVQDVIKLAGGLKDDADETKVNLAQKLQDEMVIYIPFLDDDMEEILPIVSDGSIGTASGTDGQKVKINQATVEEVQTLNGIGPKKAEAIISHREEHGPFQTIDDLTNVSGIGEKTVDNLREAIIIP